MSHEEATRVVIYTDNYRIDGWIALVPGARLTDFIRNAQEFIALTDAVVSDKSGVELFRTAFLDVGREFIELILPAALARFPDPAGG